MCKKRKPEDGLETTEPVPKKHKKNSEVKETTKGFAEQIKGRVELLETTSDQANLISVKETVDETTPDFVAVRKKKTLFVDQLAPQTEISDIIDFFKSVGEVVRVRLVVDRKGRHVGDCFVEFASSNEAKKALQEKNGEYLHNREILLDHLADKGATHPAPKYCIDHKVWNEDCLQLESLPRKKDETPPDFVEKALFVANLSPQTTKISDFIKFFQGVGKVVTVRFVVDRKGKHVGYGFVEFASSNEAKRALEKKNGEYLHDHQILLMKGLDETPDPVKAAAVRLKTLFVANLKPRIKISHIIDFFKDVGEVVHVRLMVDPKGMLVGCCFVEFASSNEAKKALQEKNGEYLHNCEILLYDLADKGATHPAPKHCIEHKVWYKDYLQRERLPIEKDETPPDFVEEVLFVANLSPRTTKISHIIKFFQGVGEVVSVRLIVDQKGKHVGYGFVEFASSNEAKRALEKKNGEYLHDHQILLMKGLDETPDPVKAAAVRIKTLFVANLKPRIKISHIIDFFKDVGVVVHVRLFVNRKGKHTGGCYVEFASANEAKKALQKKNGGCLHNRKIIVKVKTGSPRPKYWVDHNVRYEDYLRRESQEDAAVEVLDETPDFDEEVAVRKKTLFVANLAADIGIPHIIKLFKDVAEVVRVQLIVDRKAKHVGCYYVEFASANEAKKVLEKSNGRYMFSAVAQIAPYPFRPKYKLAEKLWYEDCLRRLSLHFETKPNLKKQEVKYPYPWRGEKITFPD